MKPNLEIFQYFFAVCFFKLYGEKWNSCYNVEEKRENINTMRDSHAKKLIH